MELKVALILFITAAFSLLMLLFIVLSNPHENKTTCFSGFKFTDTNPPVQIFGMDKNPLPCEK